MNLKQILKKILGEEASTSIEKNIKAKKLENLYSECKKLEYEIHTKEIRLKYDIKELTFDIEMSKAKAEDMLKKIDILEKEIRNNSGMDNITINNDKVKKPTTFTLDNSGKL